MESVKNSVKKKSRRKKTENVMSNKSEIEIVDISNVLTTNMCLVSTNTECDVDTNVEFKENTAHDVARINEKRKINSKLPRHQGSRRCSVKSAKCALNTDSPKKGDIKTTSGFSTQVKAADIESSKKTSNNSTPKVNAFALMMDTRNRTIGLIQTGVESKKTDDSYSSPVKAKNRLLLQEWEKRGGSKRKIDETQREECATNPLEKRTKRLKKTISKKIDAPQSERKKVEAAKSADRVFHTKSDIVHNSLQGYQDSEALCKTTRIYNQSKQSRKSNEHELGNKTGELNYLQNGACLDRRSGTMSSIESGNKSSDNKGSDFVKQQSTPSKKKDSLLGYFHKINSPRDNEEEDENASGKAMHHANHFTNCDRKTKRISNSNQLADKSIVCEETPIRPRRSCVERTRSDDYLCVSREVANSLRKKRNKTNDKSNGRIKDKIQQSRVCKEVVCVDIGENKSPEERASKLAPVFGRSVPRPALDSSILQARKEFLMSGIPEKMKMEIAKQREFDECYKISLDVFFPKVSHVGCSGRDTSICSNRNIDWGKCGVVWRECANSPDRRIALFKTPNIRPLTPRKEPLPVITIVENVVGKVDIIRNLKVSYGKFPTYRCYKQLRAKFKSTKSDLAVQQMSDSFVILGTNHKLKNQSSEILVNGELMFTEKYKPLTVDQVLVNFHPVNELKSFLLNCQNGRRLRPSDSLLEFEGSSDSSLSSSWNYVVLYGPSSSGKTNAVYALAHEMNFNVLEINAGMKRTGKKLLQELQEATQSHIVNNEKSSIFRNNEFQDKNADGSDSSSSPGSNPNMKRSLILIEDADIVFEQDSGFIEAIYQLVGTSKRPVIIISNSATCLHLHRLQKQSSVEFPAPNVINISKLLSIMSLVENCPIDLDEIVRLYVYNVHNLRKTLLEIQFFIESGGDRVQIDSDRNRLIQSPQEFFKEGILEEIDRIDKSTEIAQTKLIEDVYVHKSLFDFFTRNQNSDFNVQFPVDFTCLYQNIGEILSGSKKYNEMLCRRCSLTSFVPGNSDDCLLQFYQNFSVASHINCREIEDWLSENLHESIAHTLIEKAIQINLESHAKIDMTPRSKPTREFLSSHLSQTFLRTNRSMGLDYDPMLRSICRSEKTRIQLERRSSRFYHYLRDKCENPNSFSTDMFESTCSVLSVSNK